MFDGELTYDRDEYIDVVYPQIKEKARVSIQKLKNAGYRHQVDGDLEMWGTQLLNEVVPVWTKW